MYVRRKKERKKRGCSLCRDRLKRKALQLAGRSVLAALSLLIQIPVLLLVAASFMPEDELLYRYAHPLGLGAAAVRASLIPTYLTLEGYGQILLRSQGFFVMFWNSCLQVGLLMLGQMAVGICGAWAFAQYPFWGKEKLYALYILLMLLPFQVTEVSAYLVLDRLKILDTHLAAILPGIWSAFPVFIMSRFFEAIPPAMLEAARLDGAGEIGVLLQVGIPLGKPGIVTAWMLGFFESWNNIERPLAYLKTPSLWPLSLYLSRIRGEQGTAAFAACVVAMLPPVLFYLNGQEEFEQGICLDGVKE